MQIRALILLLIAIVMGGATVYMVNSYLQREVGRREVVETVKTTPLVVARVDITPGTRLNAELLNVVDWPQEALPENYFSNIAEVIGADPEKAPPILLRETHKGEPILQYILSPYGARGGLPRRIPEDMRAVTVKTTEVQGVAGFVLPGDYVDVMHTTAIGRADKNLVTRIILQNARVLAVDQINSEAETEPKVVNAITLLVSPFDAQKVTLAQSLGELTLMLRNEFDASVIDEAVATYSELLTIEKDRPTRIIKRVRRPQVEIIRGLEVIQKTVEEQAKEALPGGSRAASPP